MEELEKAFWDRMKGFTAARVGLGRAGSAQPTRALLNFQLGHAEARDAVHAALPVEDVASDFQPGETLIVASQARDRAAYLSRPDLGRQLDADCADRLRSRALGQTWDIVFVIADGLSATAAKAHAATVVRRCLPALADLRVAPIVIATQARVALADEIAICLNARAVVILLGERPGLSVSNSLGLYLTWLPHIGIKDSRRNCISNIHTGGLHPTVAADTAIWLIREAIRLKISGVGLKEKFGSSLLPTTQNRDLIG